MGWFRFQNHKRERFFPVIDADRRDIGTMVAKKMRVSLRHPDLVYFTIRFHESAQPTTEQLAILNQANDELNRLAAENDFRIPVIFTINGQRDWIIYAKNGEEVSNFLLNAMDSYEPELEWMRDWNWSQYRIMTSKAWTS